MCIDHTWCTELTLCSQAFVTSSIWLFLVCKYRGTGNLGLGNRSSRAVMSRENQKEDTWEPLPKCTIDQSRDEARQFSRFIQ